jgi:predicted regulator of Ras-like GTPase activity (Roadblock/LC7/MglB family)
MLAVMDAEQAIADLTEISPQVKRVAVVAADGTLVGSNIGDEAAAQRLADGARRLVEEAEAMRPDVAQLEAATVEGSVFVVRDGERIIAATTTPEPTVGLVFYDLKTCLRSITDAPAEPEPKPKPKRPRKKKEEEETGDATA